MMSILSRGLLPSAHAPPPNLFDDHHYWLKIHKCYSAADSSHTKTGQLLIIYSVSSFPPICTSIK